MKEVVVFDPTIDGFIEMWLKAKYGRSNSERTRQEYVSGIRSFRAFLQDKGLELTSDERLIALSAQAWAAEGVTREYGPAAFNKRIAVISSFYEYCIRQGFEHRGILLEHNPMRRVERRQVQAYRNVRTISRETIKKALSGIQTDSLEGKRDKALLMLALVTGRRLSEIANMRRENLSWLDERCTIHFPRTKGGKSIRDTLTRGVSSLLGDYLTTMDSLYPQHAPNAVWISLSPNGRGCVLSGRSIERICKKHLDTEHFHILRHVFAQEMENAGAKTSEIQARLQHSNLATTGIYLAQLHNDINPYAGILESLFQD